jgi:hypothetical protein
MATSNETICVADDSDILIRTKTKRLEGNESETIHEVTYFKVNKAKILATKSVFFQLFFQNPSKNLTHDSTESPKEDNSLVWLLEEDNMCASATKTTMEIFFRCIHAKSVQDLPSTMFNVHIDEIWRVLSLVVIQGEHINVKFEDEDTKKIIRVHTGIYDVDYKVFGPWFGMWFGNRFGKCLQQCRKKCFEQDQTKADQDYHESDFLKLIFPTYVFDSTEEMDGPFKTVARWLIWHGTQPQLQEANPLGRDHLHMHIPSRMIRKYR